MKLAAFRVGRLKSKPVWILILFCLFIFFLNRGVHNYREQILSIKVHSEKFSAQSLSDDRAELDAINKQLTKARPVKEGKSVQIKGDYRLVVSRRNAQLVYLFDDPAVLLEPRTGRYLTLPDGGQCLRSVVRRLNDSSRYGQLLPWPEVDKIFRKFDKATVRDLETGMSFAVQRRAGRYHADVQPLTAEDSAVMKTIYGGSWSWKRRAIVVEIKGHRIAASMNGMPHGAGAIGGNDFNGHFCIHFKDSKLHSNKVNLAHQLMIWKAANVVEDMMGSAGPQYVAEVMLEAIAQGDPDLALKFIKTSGSPGAKEVKRQLGEIRWIAVSEVKQVKAENESFPSINVVVSYGLDDGTQVKNRRIPFTLIRDQGGIPWKADALVIQKFFEKEDKDSESPSPDESVYQEWKTNMEM